jgi:hypothetical protein
MISSPKGWDSEAISQPFRLQARMPETQGVALG